MIAVSKACAITAFTVTSSIGTHVDAAGFRPGHLVATDRSQIYMIDPVTEVATTILEGQADLGDIVYNPVTDSLFVASGASRGDTIWEVTWDASSGYNISTFLEGLDSVSSLAVNQDGLLYFNQQDFVNHQVWSADPDGNVMAVSGSPFGFLFVPEFMNLSADETSLFVSNSPSNNIEVVSLPEGELSTLTDDLDFPSGLDVAENGEIYVAHGFGDDQVSIVSPTGVVETYLDEDWMSGAAADIEFDDATGNLYVLDRDLWVIDSDLNSRKVLDGNFFVSAGLDLIPAEGAPVPGDCNADGDVNARDLGCVATLSERDTVLQALNTLPGDLDGDGEVAFADFLVLSANFGQDLPDYSSGNIDLTAGVAFADFLILSANFGQSPVAENAFSAVPEPNASSLLLLGLLPFRRRLAQSSAISR